MKKTILPLIVTLCLTLFGCSEKEDKCVDKPDLNGYFLPDECYDCEWYAPEGVNISWTEYNTVSDVCTFFNRHRETLREHTGDTIKIEGWVCLLDSAYIDTWRLVLSDFPHEIALEEKNVLSMYLISPDDVASYYYKKVYIECKVRSCTSFGHPCDYYLCPELICIDTILN